MYKRQPWYGNVLEIERDENGVIFAASDWWTHVFWYSLPEENGDVWTQFTDPDLVVHGIQDLIFDHHNNAWLACENGGIRMANHNTWNANTDVYKRQPLLVLKTVSLVS